MVDQSRPDEEALLVPLQSEAAAIDDNLPAFFLGLGNPAFDALLVFGCDDGAIMRFGIV